ncbi:hypothetical protein C9374_000133 [Naegleria lovaniensis]|uniref:Uncharacterized protein n=1 Tax=Naegleria lovaniensis TaxID=51637 RepID=A0AA88GZ81_NAELO|nr:uncharacterized protein C9374_000133 [Naegleria lovaniensis]KAG2388694.1 hypothetical protein C9374_000133 [Naegleria lovaniensis]
MSSQDSTPSTIHILPTPSSSLETNTMNHSSSSNLRPDSKPFQPSSQKQRSSFKKHTPKHEPIHSDEQPQLPLTNDNNNNESSSLSRNNNNHQRPPRSSRGGFSQKYVKKVVPQETLPSCTIHNDDTTSTDKSTLDNTQQAKSSSQKRSSSQKQRPFSQSTLATSQEVPTAPSHEEDHHTEQYSSHHKSKTSKFKQKISQPAVKTNEPVTSHKKESKHERKGQKAFNPKKGAPQQPQQQQPSQPLDASSMTLQNTTPVSTTPSSEHQHQQQQHQQRRKKKFQNHPSSQNQDEEDEMFWSHSYDREQLKKRNFTMKGVDAFSSLPSSSSIRESSNRSFKKLKNRTLSDEQVSALSLHDRLIYELTKQTYTCLICRDTIARHHATWYCQDCFGVFHLNCVQRWVKEKIEDEDRTYWKCPACQSSLISAIPTEYKCFCGKMTNPKASNLEIIPHSCGEICGKIHKPCSHPCTELCHPGPCHECQLQRDLTCHCGKEHYYRVKCNDPKFANGISCGKVCGRLLSCQKHYCPKVCHEGECEPCHNLITAQCYCGKTLVQDAPCHVYSHLNADISHRHFNRFDILKRTAENDLNSRIESVWNNNTSKNTDLVVVQQGLPSQETHALHLLDNDLVYRTFSCKQVCKHKLPCGQHECDRPCHYGRCIGHKRSEWNVKPTSTMNQSSSEDDEEGIDEYIKRMGCYQQCRKTLKCGHLCTLKCHPNRSECMKCNNLVDWYCKCGRKYEKRPCSGSTVSAQDLFLECDDECRKLLRIKQLADAFKVDYEKFELPQYSQELIDFGTRYLHVIKNWEFEFDSLLVSDVKGACKQFAPMKRDRRALLHELSEHYKFTSVSVDAEPFRSVIVTKTQQSKRPSIVLSDVISDPEKLRKLKEKMEEQAEKERREEMKRLKKKESEWMDAQQQQQQQELEDHEQGSTSLTLDSMSCKWNIGDRNASEVLAQESFSENDSSFDPYSFTSIQAAMSGRRRGRTNTGGVSSDSTANLAGNVGVMDNSFSALLEHDEHDSHQDIKASLSNATTNEVMWKEEDEDDTNVKSIDL